MVSAAIADDMTTIYMPTKVRLILEVLRYSSKYMFTNSNSRFAASPMQ